MTRGEGVLDLVEWNFAIIIGFKPPVNPSWLIQVKVPSTRLLPITENRINPAQKMHLNQVWFISK
jgi:hypothetical protein